MSIETVIPSNHLILCRPLFLLPSIFPSIRSRKYWSFSFNISPSNEYSGFISYRIDCFDLLAVQETLKSLLQHHSLKASILQHSDFFMVQFSHLLVTTRKTIALTIWTFVGKVRSLFFNTLCRFVIVFLPKSKCLLISWLQSPSTVILEPKKIKSFTVSTFSPSICHEMMGPDAMILVFWMLSFKPTFSLSSFTFIKRLFSSSSLSANYTPVNFFFLNKQKQRRKQWLSKESSLQCKGQGSIPDPRRSHECTATTSMCHKYWACALEPAIIEPTCPEPMLCDKRSHHNEKPANSN